MENELKKQIAAEMISYFNEHQMSANDFAKNIGVNISYISNIRNANFTINSGGGKETPISDKYFIKIAEAIGLKLQKSYWQTVSTPQMNKTLITLEDALQNGNTNAIIGETGCGKSFTCQMFASANPMDVHIVTVGSNDRITDLMDKVLEKIKIPQAKTKSKKILDIVRYFKNKRLEGRKQMLLFDETEYMKQPTLCSIKEFYDNLIGECAIVLIGTDQLIDNINKLRLRNKTGIPQLYRRIKFGIVNLPSIDRSFKPFLTDITDKGLVNFLKQNCDNYGELHDVLVTAKREADLLNVPLTENFVRVLFNLPENK